MNLPFFILLFIAVLVAAAPQLQDTSTTCTESHTSYSSTTTSILNATLTVTRTYTHTVTPMPVVSTISLNSSTPSTAGPFTNTTGTISLTRTLTATGLPPSATGSSTNSSELPVRSPPFVVISAHSGSPVHLLPFTASNFRFHLGGDTVSYCPLTGGCPPGNDTALLDPCSMDVLVPGGQSIWATADGRIGYTQVHSSFKPAGSIPCPLSYRRASGERFGHLSTHVFGARGLMACPDLFGGWEVFAALKNATVPTGNVSDCYGFDGLTTDYSSSHSNFSAWQYT